MEVWMSKMGRGEYKAAGRPTCDSAPLAASMTRVSLCSSCSSSVA